MVGEDKPQTAHASEMAKGVNLITSEQCVVVQREGAVYLIVKHNIPLRTCKLRCVRQCYDAILTKRGNHGLSRVQVRSGKFREL